ncbi:MAG: aminotransferase class IV [Dehalococcoidales bacterium]
MPEIVYLNGSLVPRSQARVSAFDHGFLYGYGLFETMRAYHGKIFRLDRHLQRLTDSAGILGMAAGLADIDLGRACTDTLAANKLADARLRLTVSRGEAPSFPGVSHHTTPTVLVAATPYSPPPPAVYAKGYTVGIASLRRQSCSVLSEMKSTSYLLSVLAKIEAERAGLDEALLLNERGLIAEGSISNVFFVRGEILVTPPVASGILPGVTRGVVMELARALAIGVHEVDIKPDEMKQFGEAFLTNSVLEIMPLVGIRKTDGETLNIGAGKPGKITRKLMDAYGELVERETSGKNG